MPELFISYRRECDEHIARVRELATQLEGEGIAVIFDEFAGERTFHGGAPPRGWDMWSIQMASQVPSVLVMGSSGWFHVINNPQPTSTGQGAAAEAETLIHRLNRKGGYNDFLSIGFFDFDKDLVDLPPYLDKCARFDVTDPKRLASLLTWLKRPLGTAPTAPDETPPASAVVSPFPALTALDSSGFLDCRSAFGAFERLWHVDNRRRVLLLEAEGEHGKSELLTRFFGHVQSALPGAAAFLRLSPPVRSAIDHLDNLADAFATTDARAGSLAERTRSLLAAIAHKPTFLFVDGFEHAESEHALWLELFLQRAIYQPLLRLVVAGRRVPSFRTQPWGIYAEHILCDALAEPDAFVHHATLCGSQMPADQIRGCCDMLRNQREERKRSGQSTDGFSPLTLINEIHRQRAGGTRV